MTVATLALVLGAFTPAAAQDRTETLDSGIDELATGEDDTGGLEPVSGDLASRDGGEDECKETYGCIDDYADPSFDGYVRALNGMIDDLIISVGTPQLDEGHTMPMSYDEKDGGIGLGDIWTEKLAPGVFIEHWFLESDDMLQAPGDSWTFDYLGPVEWSDMEPMLQADPDHLSESYIEMLVEYVDVPDAASLAGDLDYSGIEVQRWRFEMKIGGSTVGHLLREWHFDGPAITARYDHWAFVQDYGAQFKAAGAVDVVAAGAPPTTLGFYQQMDSDATITRAAVVEYTPELVSDTCLLGGPGCGIAF